MPDTQRRRICILEADVDIFDAINFDRADRVGDILDRDPGAIDRPFKAYASCQSREGQWWPAPDCTPLEWATSQGKPNAIRILTERGAGARTPDDRERAERIVAFLQSACWDHQVHGKGDHRMHDRAAQRILAQDPSIARDSIYTAIVCGDQQEVARILAARPEAARQARRAARLDAHPLSCLHALLAPADHRAGCCQSPACCSTTAPIRMTSTWPATPVTPSSSA